MEDTDVVDTFEKYVKSVYNFQFSLKEEQVKILSSLLNERNVFAVMPTGYGKSMCYVLPSLILDELDWTVKHTTVVISPLSSLMADQVKSLDTFHIRSVAIDKDTTQETVNGVIQGEYSVVFISPERAVSKYWWNVFLTDTFQKSVCLVALDECHCLTEWGEDFRPKYREVRSIRSVLSTPIVCLTATADKRIKDDVLKTMSLLNEDTDIIATSSDRPNIFLDIRKSKQRVGEDLEWIVEIIAKGTCAKTIIFCRTVSDVSTVYEFFRDSLHERGVPEDEEKVMTYWQEVGRGGRDGRPNLAVLYVYGRSMDVRRTSKDIRTIVKGSMDDQKCVRTEVLSFFQLKEEDKFERSRVCSTKVCDTCDCNACWCYMSCYHSCLCNTKKDCIDRFLKL